MLLKRQLPAAGSSPVTRIVEAASQIILGKEAQIRMALACILARGHLLIEDIPGVGKTTLAHVLARSLGLHFQRIQFTSDMLPADILGVSIYERASTCASVVLPTPGMSSISRWPRARMQASAMRICASLPRMIWPAASTMRATGELPAA